MHEHKLLSYKTLKLWLKPVSAKENSHINMLVPFHPTAKASQVSPTNSFSLLDAGAQQQ